MIFLSPNCTQHCTAGGRGRNSSNLRICNPARSGKHKPLARHWGRRTRKMLKAAALLLQSRLEGNGDKQRWLSPLAGYRVEPPSLPPSPHLGGPAPGTRARGMPRSAPGDARGLRTGGFPGDPLLGGIGVPPPRAPPLTPQTAAGSAGRRARAGRCPLPRRRRRRPAPPAPLPWPGPPPP